MLIPDEYSQSNKININPSEAAGEKPSATAQPGYQEQTPYRVGRVYTPNAPEGTPFYTTQPPIDSVPPLPRKKKGGSRSFLAFLLILLLAGSAGYGGSWLFARTNQGRQGNTDIQSTGENVLYQSVIRTVGNEESREDILSISDVAQVTAPSVVEIVTEKVNYNAFLGQYPTSGAGSGVILSKEGLIVTNHHVVNGAGTINVTVQQGKSFPARILGSDEENDLAVLKIEAGDTPLSPALLGNSDELKVGDPVIAIGNPLGELGGTVTNGIISALDRRVDIDGKKLTLLQTNAAVNPGNSGGGLFSMYGELIGIINAKITNSGNASAEGLGFAIPIGHASPVIEELTTYGYVRGRIDVGLEFLEVSNQATAMYYNVSKSGVYIRSVKNTVSGFEVGDMLLSIDGTEIITAEQLEAVLDAHKVGDRLSITVERRIGRKQYKEFAYQLVLQEKAPN